MLGERTQGSMALPKWANFAFLGIWAIPFFLIEFPMWMEITIAGVAMGMLIFLTAVGLTIIFGLMDVLNFGHGAFFTIGAYVGLSIFNAMGGWVESENIFDNLVAIGAGVVAAGAVTFLLGIIMERLIIAKVYGDHLLQILITMGTLIFLEEVVKIIWGPSIEYFPTPVWFQDAWLFGDVLFSHYRALVIVIGIVAFVGIQLVLNKTKIGLVVRAGVENPEMVQSMGYNLKLLFTGVFAAGSALAGIGGLMWAGYKESLHPGLGTENLTYTFIVVIIGGLGSVTGSLLGAILVGVTFNYVAFLMPQMSLGINILLMTLILMVKPQGLFANK